MKRRVFVGSAFAGAALTGAYAKPQKPQAGSIPTRTFGKTGVKVHMIAQGKVGHRAAFHDGHKTAVPLSEAVSRQKQVPLDSDLVRAALGLTICIGNTL